MATRCFSPPESFRPRSPTIDVIAQRQFADEFVDLGVARGFLDLGLVGADAAIGDVVTHRIVEQHGVLRNDADDGAQRCLRHVADVLAVDRHAARFDIVEAIENAGDRRLARARRAHDRDRLAGRHGEADALEHHALRIVGEHDIVETDLAARDFERLGARLVRHFLRLMQQAEHGVHVHQRLRDFAIDRAQQIERHIKLRSR